MQRTEDLRLTTEELRQSENLLRIIADMLPAFISYVDKNQVYIFANKFYYNLYFVTESPIGKRINEVLKKLSMKQARLI